MRQSKNSHSGIGTVDNGDDDDNDGVDGQQLTDAIHQMSNDRLSVAIIGGGIGGLALAAACLHRSIPFQV